VNAAERNHLDAVASLGCIVCHNEGMGYAPAEIHHLKRNPETGAKLGMSQRASHYHTIPLCPTHHRAGGFGVAYHAGPRQFEKLYGTETELWGQVRERLRGAA
jgi:hypothetical protein